MRALALAAAVAAVAGCTEHQTEMILVITAEGVRIPDDVHKVHLTVADRQGGNDDTVYDADVELCTPSLTTACYKMPVTAALFPGKSHGTDSVRVQVTALGGNGPVIDDAALFTFADKQSLRLDFVLYANCLGNVECAKRDQACGPLDTCIDLHPGKTNGPLDIALPPNPADLSVADMTLVDLANADLTSVPPDLVSNPPDMAGCAGIVCDMGQQCVGGVCMACGNFSDPCCFGPTAPPPNPNAGGPVGGTCNMMNLVCNGTICVNCGATGELCCQAVPPCNNGIDQCVMGTCQTPMSPPDLTSFGMDMSLMVSDGGVSLSD